MSTWPTKPLKDIATIVRGVSFDKSQVSKDSAESSVPILRAGNINSSLDTLSDLVYVSPALVSESQLLRVGDIAICMSSGSSSVVGKTAQLRHEWLGSVGAFCAIIRFHPSMNSRYGAYWFKSNQFLAWRDANAKGANIQNLRRAELEKLNIPIPPIAEQERIVKLLDEADALRKLRAQADQRTAQLIPALFHDMFGDPVSTEGVRWPTLCLAELIETGPQNGLYKHSSSYGNGSPILRIDSFYGGEVKSLNTLKRLRALSDEIARYQLKKDDIVVNRVNSPAYLGKSALVPDLVEPTLFESNMMRFTVNTSRIVPVYLTHYLQTAPAKHHILGRAKHSINQSSVNQDDIKSLPVPLPPRLLQQLFAKRLAEIRELEANQVSSSLCLDHLFQSVLQRAFAGEL